MTEPAYKVCTGCGKAKPETLEYFFANKREGDKVYLKTQCKDCINVYRRNKKASMRREHPTHRGDNEDANGFVWDKNTQARFVKIAEVIASNNLTPQEILGMSPGRAKELSYNLGAKLKLVKYTIRSAHPEAMQVLFPPTSTPTIIEDTWRPVEQWNDIPDEQEPDAPMTLRMAAELLINVESRLESANIDLETARKMYEDAQAAVTSIKTERREAVRLLADMARELDESE